MEKQTVKFVIYGEPASKANSRKIVKFGSKPASIKSDKARIYEEYALPQIPMAARIQLAGKVRATIRIFYATERPDLDESVVLDILQDRYKSLKVNGIKQRMLVQKGVYKNDRQVREKHIYHGIDKENPRAEIEISEL